MKYIKEIDGERNVNTNVCRAAFAKTASLLRKEFDDGTILTALVHFAIQSLCLIEKSDKEILKYLKIVLEMTRPEMEEAKKDIKKEKGMDSTP